jgi:hypothetical protein
MPQLEEPEPYIMVAIEYDAESVIVDIEPPQPPPPQSMEDNVESVIVEDKLPQHMVVDNKSQPPEPQSMDIVEQELSCRLR